MITPLYDNVVIKKDDENKVSNGGIILTGDNTEKPNQGEVVAIGTGKLLDDGTQKPVNVKIGDRVVFNQFAGYEVKVDGEQLWIMKDSDIFGKIS